METIATFSKPEDAHLMRMHLEAGGITAYVQDDDSQLANPITGTRVQVADEDAAAARDLLAADKGVTESE